MNSYEEKQEARKERYLQKAAAAQQQSSNLFDHAHDMAKVIPFGQPIACNSNAQRDRNYRAKIGATIDRGLKESEKSDYYTEKAATIGTGGISSDDPDAIKKLTEKLNRLQAMQEKMKASNKAIRKNDHKALQELGYTKEGIKKLFTPDCFGGIGFPAYSLQNNNAEIRRLKQRIASLTKTATCEPVVIETEHYTYKEEDNRCQFIFDGKPDEETREILKRNAFKWSPSRTAWVRQLTGNGRYAAKNVIKQLEVQHE